MPLHVTKPFPRLWSVEAGIAMVVTDLHGDWDAYQRYRDRFLHLHANEQVDCLIFTGDLIHKDTPPDSSLDIVLDVLQLRATYGDAILYLCGNHELPHIYGFPLRQRKHEYTPPFERALSQCSQRQDVIRLFDSLPFYLRTTAGVTLAHAGASEELKVPRKAQRLFNWDHQEQLAWARSVLAERNLSVARLMYARERGNASYEELVQHHLAVDDVNDPRYDDLLRGELIVHHPEFDMVWSALFSRCEKSYGTAAYASIVPAALRQIAAGFVPQEVLVAGHMTTLEGYHVVGKQHLRLSSAAHATPRESGMYLLFDTAHPVSRVSDLYKHLHSVFE